MTEDYRDLHVLAGGTPRVEKLHGRDHLVVPVVALMEGVIHAINADTPEFVSTGVLSSAAHTFNGRPLVLGHPVQNGRQISANSPGVVERQGFGTIYESKTNGPRLGMEAWIDPVRLEALNQQDLLARVRAGKPIEVSVGAYVKTSGISGQHNGKRYANEWREVQGDHLAFLPNGRGACSLEMGCGACRMAEQIPTLYSLEGAEPVALGGPGSGHHGHSGRPGQVGGSEPGDGDGADRKDGSDSGVSKSTIESIIGESFHSGTERTIGNKTSVLKRVQGRAKERKAIGDKLVAKGFRKYAGRTKSEDAYSTPDQKSIVSVKQQGKDLLVEYIRTLEAYCLSALSIDPLEAEVEELRAALGARNNASDKRRIQEMHDACVELGAECEHYRLRENQIRDAAESILVALGGPGSGNFGHAGRPGEIGGSGPGGGSSRVRVGKLQRGQKISLTTEGGGKKTYTVKGVKETGHGTTEVETEEGQKFNWSSWSDADVEDDRDDLKSSFSASLKEAHSMSEEEMYKNPALTARNIVEGALENPSDAGKLFDKASRAFNSMPEKTAKQISAKERAIQYFRFALTREKERAQFNAPKRWDKALRGLGAFEDDWNLKTATIKNEGGKYILYTKDGSRKLGTHDTRAEAEAQEKAIEAAKRRRSAELAGDAVVEEHKCSCKGKH